MFFFNYIFSQDEKFKLFVNSFPVINKGNILKFGEVIQTGKSMSKNEAFDLVYHGDSTKLYCTEQILGESTELHLPSKCFKINTDKYYLIGYTSYQCQSKMDDRIWDMVEISLNIMIVDKEYKIRDTMIVYRGNDYYYDITGIFNPLNNNMFLLREKNGFMYKINSQEMKFELVKNFNDIPLRTENLEKTLEQIGWKEIFNN